MLTHRPYIRVRIALIADRFRAVVESVQNCPLTTRDIAALSVSGHTVEEARSKFRLVFNALKRQRKLPGYLAVTLLRPRRRPRRDAARQEVPPSFG